MLSSNLGLPWSQVLIDRYAGRWDWRSLHLSSNPALPWSQTLIDRYTERWDWGTSGLSGNAGLPWSHTLFDRFAERWDLGSVAEHYDGNVQSLTPERVDRLMRMISEN